MAIVRIPPVLRPSTGGVKEVDAAGERLPDEQVLVEGLDLVRDEPERPAVRDDVVNRDNQLVLVGSQAEQHGTKERAAREAERALHLLLHLLLHRRLPVRGRHVFEVDGLGLNRLRVAFSEPYILSHGNPYGKDSFPPHEIERRIC